MNQETFQKAAGISAELAARWYPHITAAMTKFGITKTEDQAMFIAQCGHESAGWHASVESFNYSQRVLCQTFVPLHMTTDQANALGRRADEKTVPLERQQAIANLVYQKRLGNHNPGDGWKFRGRGLVQITFLSNYLNCGKAIGVDLIEHPELLEQDQYAALSAAWFFVSRGCLKVSGDITRTTQLINGGLNGFDDRNARYKVALKALKST